MQRFVEGVSTWSKGIVIIILNGAVLLIVQYAKPKGVL